MSNPDIISVIQQCRICKGTALLDAIDLGEQYITSRFPLYGDFSTPKTQIVLSMCQDCGLLQLKHTTKSSELYEYEYGYRSGLSNTMRAHLKEYQMEIVSKVNLEDSDTVLDIGSNDSTMLQYYPSTVKRIGIDPTGKQFQQYYQDVDLIPTYFTKGAFQSSYGDRKCKIVSSISMFYDLPDPVQFARDIYDILDDEGIWTCEQSYVLTMLKQNSLDTICHEHLEYYGLRQIQEIAQRSRFKIVDVKFNDCNGGSFRIYLAKDTSKTHVPNTDHIQAIRSEEDAFGINKIETYHNFMKKCDYEVKKLKDFIEAVNQCGKRAWVYGASTKGNCLLQYANLTEADMKYAVERNPNKVGKMTSTGIPIISEETMRQENPEFLVVFPWHFRNEIVERERAYLERGGQLIFPLPHFEIVSAKPRILITGCDGHIAHYVKKEFSNTHTVYGITNRPSNQDVNVIKFTADVCDPQKVEQILDTVKPEAVIHLAGISSSERASQEPILTLQVNGMSAAYLCEAIHRNKWDMKLFNTTSSEMFKGHVDYTVTDDDTHMYHLHPYSIAKISSQSIVDYYRVVHNQKFSNGILFMTESWRKKGNFLLNKIATHARTWKETKNSLTVGNLDSYRSVIHASDVASAIRIILEQPQGNSYVICNSDSVPVYKMVEELYSVFGISVERKDNMYIEVGTGLPVLHMGNQLRGVNTKILGDASRLRTLGWSPKTTLRGLMEDIHQECS